MAQFVVYEHWRPDKNICFYVGITCTRNRATRFSRRNKVYTSIVGELRSIGREPEVRIVKSNLSQTEAFALEMERIAFWGRTNLSNLTDGGDGVRNPLPETRAKIGLKSSIANKGRVQSAETRAKRSASMKGKPKSEAHKAKLRGPRPAWIGAKISEVRRGKPLTPEHCANLARAWAKKKANAISNHQNRSAAPDGNSERGSHGPLFD